MSAGERTRHHEPGPAPVPGAAAPRTRAPARPTTARRWKISSSRRSPRPARAAAWRRRASGAWPHGTCCAPRQHGRSDTRSSPSATRPVERRVLMLGTDLKYTFRSLARQKLSTALVVGMLALGIAANVVVFGLVERPVPAALPLSRARSPRLHQRDRAALEPRGRRRQLPRLRAVAAGRQALRRHRAL